MSYNLPGYLVYVLATFFIIVRVGAIFYKNGRLYILALFAGHEEMADRTNRLLLAGYYLLNLGYALWSISTWRAIESAGALVAVLSSRIGFIMLALAALHYLNMAVIYLLSKRNNILHP